MNLHTSWCWSCVLDDPGCWHIRRSQGTRCAESCGGQDVNEGMKLWFISAGKVNAKFGWLLMTDSVSVNPCLLGSHWNNWILQSWALVPIGSQWHCGIFCFWMIMEVMMPIDFLICRSWRKRWRQIRKFWGSWVNCGYVCICFTVLIFLIH